VEHVVKHLSVKLICNVMKRFIQMKNLFNASFVENYLCEYLSEYQKLGELFDNSMFMLKLIDNKIMLPHVGYFVVNIMI